MKYSIDPIHPTLDLTTDEKTFLNGLSAFTIPFESLLFQIDDLQRHTELVLSGEIPTRWEFPDRKGLEEEIEELEELIKWVWKRIERGELKQEELALPDMLEGQLARLREALKDMDEAPSSKPKLVATNLLGLYQHNSGRDSRVTLYVNNIKNAARIHL